MPFTCLLHLCYIRDNIHVCEEISTFAKSSHTRRNFERRWWWWWWRCTNTKKPFPNILILFQFISFFFLLLLLLPLLLRPHCHGTGLLKFLCVGNVKIPTTINPTRIFNCIFISRSFSFPFQQRSVVRWSPTGSRCNTQISVSLLLRQLGRDSVVSLTH